MCPDVSRGPRLGAALGLILPLVLAGTAAAQSPAWVDPPAKTAAPKTAAPKTAAPKTAAPQAVSTETPPTKAAPTASVPAVSPPEEPRPAQAATEPSPMPASAETERDGAAMGGPSRRAERPRLRHRAARRLSDTPAADTPAAGALTVAPRIPSAPREAAADPRFSGWAGQAQGLADDYLAAFSGPNAAMVAGASRFYAERLRFHGRTTTLAALLTEKRRFAQRWPERRYEPRDTRTACNAALQSCIVRILVDFRAASPARGARSQGVAELVLEVSFAGDRPVIVSESSRVLRRGATLGALSGGRASG